MALKKKLATAPEAALAGFYKQVSPTEWLLDLEGDEPAAEDAKVKEYRDNNIRLARERDELMAKLKEAETQRAQLAPKAEQSQTLEQRVAQLTQQWEESQARAKAAEANARLEQFRGSLLSTATKHKVRDEAAAKVLLAMASQTYKEKDGKFVPLNEQGQVLYSKKLAAEPMPIEEWIEERKAGDYRDLFAQPQGGSAKGSGAAFGLGGKTPKILISKAQAQSGAYLEQIASGEAAIQEEA